MICYLVDLKYIIEFNIKASVSIYLKYVLCYQI